jgi:glucose-1-phosphate adenylyltransferase
MPNVKIGRNSRIRRAIIDSGVQIPESTVIGFDRGQDLARGFTVTESGIVVVPSRPMSVVTEIPASSAAN